MSAHKEEIAQSTEDLITLFSSIQDKDEIKQLFSELFTTSELRDVVLRWQLLKDLTGGLTQRAIASKYNISLCKITRGSKILKNQDSIVRAVLVDHKYNL